MTRYYDLEVAAYHLSEATDIATDAVADALRSGEEFHDGWSTWNYDPDTGDVRVEKDSA